MKIISCIFLFGSLLLAGCKCKDDTPSPPDTVKPNVIFILADDYGYEIPTVNGGESYDTKHLDMMAAAGMRFTQCYSAPMCSPTRSMLLTGKYCFRNYGQWGVMNASEKTLGNMFQNNGYKTCYAGKWQLDGGGTRINSFGFEDYLVWLPFEVGPERNGGSRYKNPKLYTKNNFLSEDAVSGKYSEDLFCDSILSFMRRHKSESFFVYYAPNLPHSPLSPTPNDKEFDNWDSDPDNFAPRFFPSMVSYLDDKLQLLIDETKKLNIDKRTIFVFVGDNGSPEGVISKFNGQDISGGKKETNTYGTHVPLIFYAPGIVPAGINEDLVDFTDFIPTLAEITGLPAPTNLGILDGQSFAPQLTGNTGKPRDYIFCHHILDTTVNGVIPSRWVQNKNYKLYEDNGGSYHNPGFYNMLIDPLELNPIPDFSLTADELAIKNAFQAVLNSMK
jgi:arylsulfatase A-like enzyme